MGEWPLLSLLLWLLIFFAVPGAIMVAVVVVIVDGVRSLRKARELAATERRQLRDWRRLRSKVHAPKVCP